MKPALIIALLFLGLWKPLSAQQNMLQGTLNTFEVQAALKPDTVLSSPEWMIRDYEFLDTFIVALTWDKHPDRCHLRLFDASNREHGAIALKAKPYALFRDAFGRVYLIDEYGVHWIDEHGPKLHAMSEEAFFGRIYPLVARSDSAWFFSTFLRNRPEFAYLKIKADTLHVVRDQHLYDLYHAEYTFMPFQQKCALKRRCAQSGEDRYALAAEMSGFTRSLWWRTPYSPLFVQGDTVWIADHYRDSVFLYHQSGLQLAAVPMSFHRDKSYKREILFDPESKRRYARFEQHGRVSLVPIDVWAQTQQPGNTLQHRYVEKLKVHKGKAWYLYRPFESSQNSFLYAEFLGR